MVEPAVMSSPTAHGFVGRRRFGERVEVGSPRRDVCPQTWKQYQARTRSHTSTIDSSWSVCSRSNNTIAASQLSMTYCDSSGASR